MSEEASDFGDAVERFGPGVYVLFAREELKQKKKKKKKSKDDRIQLVETLSILFAQHREVTDLYVRTKGDEVGFPVLEQLKWKWFRFMDMSKGPELFRLEPPKTTGYWDLTQLKRNLHELKSQKPTVVYQMLLINMNAGGADVEMI